MLRFEALTFLYSICRLLIVASAQDDPLPVSRELFDSLEELSRLVDISYCVGTTGVQEPFQCLSHCAEFPNLELVMVSAHYRAGCSLNDISCLFRHGTLGYSSPTRVATSHSPTHPGPSASLSPFEGHTLLVILLSISLRIRSPMCHTRATKTKTITMQQPLL